MAVKGEDRRIQRTRSALRQALMELILERGYEGLTVQDIIDRANVGRSTFYAHFLDKQQLLLASIGELRTLLTEQQRIARETRGGLSEGEFAFSRAMFDHAASHAPLYHALLGKQGGAIVLREIQHMLSDLARAELAAVAPLAVRDVFPQEALVQYVVSGFVGLLVWWLDAGRPCTVEQVDQLFQTLTVPGIKGALVPNARG